MNNDYDFKIKNNAVAINMKNPDTMKALIVQAEELAYDDSKNEKLAVEFRTILLVKGECHIVDISAYLDKTPEGKLLDGKSLKSYAEQYCEYIENSMNDKNSNFYKNIEKNYGHITLEQLKNEIITTYYPLDPKNKKENIPDLGNLVTYCKYIDNKEVKMVKYTVDCSKDVKCVPDISMAASIAQAAKSIKNMRANIELDNATPISSYNKNTLH